MNEMLGMQLEVTKSIFQANTAGLTHEDSLRRPTEAGNSLNWIGGHLVTAYNDILSTLGEEPVWPQERTEVYKRGSDSLTDTSRAVDFGEIVRDFETAHERVMHGLGNLAPERLGEPAPYSPGNNPNETLDSLLHLIAFHQAYHVGQLGLGRRLLGVDGAIK